MSPTARTLKLLRDGGYLATVCEQWLRKIDRRRDLFGIADVIGVNPHRAPHVLLVQCTTRGNLSSRIKKVSGSPALGVLLAAGIAVECWGWDGATVKRVSLQPDDLQPEVLTVPARRRRQTHTQGSLFDFGQEPEPAAPEPGS